MADAHVAAIADATEAIIAAPRRRVAAVIAAHDAGMSYPAISRAVYVELLTRGHSDDVIDGAGIGPDNLRKMSAGE